RRYMQGDTYTIVDMGVWGWTRLVPTLFAGALDKCPNVKRLTDEISARPAAAKAVALRDRFKWKAEMDDEARSNMFKHLAVKVAGLPGGPSQTSAFLRHGRACLGHPRCLRLTGREGVDAQP